MQAMSFYVVQAVMLLEGIYVCYYNVLKAVNVVHMLV